MINFLKIKSMYYTAFIELPEMIFTLNYKDKVLEAT